MNERIKSLAEQADPEYTGEYNDDMGHALVGNEAIQRFAQLIVRECADIAYKTSWDDLVHGYGQAVIPLHLHNTIKEHFGVEL